MEETSEARRKRLKALTQEATAAGAADAGTGAVTSLVNPLAADSGGGGSSGPCSFYRCGLAASASGVH